jgi:hypothetical protein
MKHERCETAPAVHSAHIHAPYFQHRCANPLEPESSPKGRRRLRESRSYVRARYRILGYPANFLVQ